MKISTMSIVVGTTACNARCPFCVSKTTPEQGVSVPQPINWRNFKEVAIPLANRTDCTTILFTGKGEPTLAAPDITDYLNVLNRAENCAFPFKELQTNGIILAHNTKIRGRDAIEYLREWYSLGLTTICISVVHWIRDMNAKIYCREKTENHYELDELIEALHKIGFSVRLSVMLLKGYIDTPEKMKDMIAFAKLHKVEQMTMRPIAYPENDNSPTTAWIKEHTLSADELHDIIRHVEVNGNLTLRLSHGAKVYDVGGQNLCLADCLTTNDTDENIRQIIFFSDGRLCYDWKYEGARLI